MIRLRTRIFATLGLLSTMSLLVGLHAWVGRHYSSSLLLFALRLTIVGVPLAALINWLRIAPHRPLIYLALLAFTVSLALAFAWVGKLDWGALAVSYLGLTLLGGASLSLGLFASSLTEKIGRAHV